MTHATRDVLRYLDRPEQRPVWRAAVATLVVIVIGDAVTPVSAPLSAGLPALLLASLIARAEPLTARLTALAVLGSVGVGVVDAVRSGGDPRVILSRLAVTTLVLLTGIWATWHARQATPAPDRTLPLPALDPGVPPVERAAVMLAFLTGARAHHVHHVDSVGGWLASHPHVTPARPHRPVGLRLPRMPAPPLLNAPCDVWHDAGASVYVRFDLAGHGEVLVQLMRPGAPTSFIADAAHILQLQLERAALVERVHVQRELLRDLVYAFSHDLRTPITANILHAEAALGGLYGPLSDPMEEFLRHALQGHRNLLTVSDQLMLLAEYESGDVIGGTRSTVDLEDVIRSVVGDVQVRGRERGIHFELTLRACHVTGHAYDLRRAVQNLLENAMKFSPEHAFVRVALRPDGPAAVIEVMDQGPGVPDAQVPQLFNRFRTSTRGSGTGFGLYLARRIAERYGGTITYARTTSDHPWTVFEFRLPLLGSG
ncbi:HAMP domain-containing sensor histidine kinase [uncultured Deinococcus sp.]|uniref:sensor histidine kinase n=1 Tax=uncultured Deinococcus sp. TaxID=158789 RepID=UPI0025DA465C|nr:HAMP domain-containing sensor histidine kinase [uncultured Deinococcus sp.]